MLKHCEHTGARLKQALRRRDRSRYDADDLIQDAYLRLMRYERLRVVEASKAALMSTSLHLSTGESRRSADEGESVLIGETARVDDAPCMDDVLCSEERLERLSRRLGCLSERTRRIFIAHRVDGMTYEAIGRRYGLSVSGVEKNIANAVLHLAMEMAGWDA